MIWKLELISVDQGIGDGRPRCRGESWWCRVISALRGGELSLGRTVVPSGMGSSNATFPRRERASVALLVFLRGPARGPEGSGEQPEAGEGTESDGRTVFIALALPGDGGWGRGHGPARC